MKKNIITAINLISFVPILLFPFILLAGSMAFDAPGSEKSILAFTVPLILIGYPIFIIVFIVLSRKKNSLLLALVALIPMLFLIYTFLFSDGLAQKSNYDTLNKDFICNANSFLSVEKNGNFGSISLLKKNNFYTYKNESVALIENNEINIMSANPREEKDLLSNCKNKEGKSLLDVYELVSD